MDEPKGAFGTLLGVRPSEMDRVLGLMRTSFLLGIGLVLFYSASNALFLTSYDISVLPWVYIVNAAIVIVVGLSYGAWSARVAPARSLMTLAVAMTVSVGALWVAGSISSSPTIAFAMAMWFRLLFIFAVLGLWEIASAVFDIRQAKRLFAAVALGMMIAFVVGGAATPILGSLIGTTNLVGLAAAAFALYTVDFGRLLTRHSIGHDTGAEGVAPAGPREIISDRYSRRMVAMKTVTILLLYISEFVFYEQAADTFETEASLAGFLGVFMGAMTVVMVLVTGLVSGRYISRFGVRVATLSLPVAMVVIALPTGLYGVIVAVDTLFFVLVAFTLATDHVVGNAIGEPAGAVLFQPMTPVRRMRVRLAVDGWLGSVALVIAGCVLLLFEALDLGSVAPFMFAIVAVAVVGVVVAIAQYRDYVDALDEATTLAFGGSSRALRELDAADIGGAPAGGDGPGAALATLGVSRALGHNPLGAHVTALLHHGDPDVVALALDSIIEAPDPALVDEVARVVERSDLTPAARQRALLTLSQLDPERATTALDGPAQSALVAVAPRVLLRHQPTIEAGRQGLDELANSPHVADRMAACEVLASGDARDDHLLVQLMHDDAGEVVDLALTAVRAPLAEAVSRRALELAGMARHRRRAMMALANVAIDDAEHMAPLMSRLPVDLRASAVRRAFGRHPDAHDLVAGLLTDDSPSLVRRACYDVLGAIGDPGEPRAAEMLSADLGFAAEVAALHRSIAPAAPLVAAALVDEFEHARTAVFGAVALAHGGPRVHDIETLIRSGSEDDRANAVEALEVMLPADVRRLVVAVLEPVDVAQAARDLGVDGDNAPGPDAIARLAEDERFTGWTRFVARHGGQDTPDQSNGGSVSSTIERVVALKRIDIFSTLPYDVIAELADLVRSEDFAEGQTIVTAGAVGDEMYALISGDVEVRAGDDPTVVLSEGTVFGELSVLDPGPRSATVIAMSDVEVLVVGRSTLLALTDRRPEVMTEIARVLARRMRR